MLGLEHHPGAVVFAFDLEGLQAVGALANGAASQDAQAPDVRFPIEAGAEGFGRAAIAVTIQVNAIVRQRRRRWEDVGLGQGVEEVDKMSVTAGGDLLDDFGVGGELFVVPARIGKGGREPFMRDRAQEDPTNPSVARVVLNGVHQLVQRCGEPGQARFAVEGIGHAVAEDDHRGLEPGDGVGQLSKPEVR